jgi:hypothetical protein
MFLQEAFSRYINELTAQGVLGPHVSTLPIHVFLFNDTVLLAFARPEPGSNRFSVYPHDRERDSSKPSAGYDLFCRVPIEARVKVTLDVPTSPSADGIMPRPRLTIRTPPPPQQQSGATGEGETEWTVAFRASLPSYADATLWENTLKKAAEVASTRIFSQSGMFNSPNANNAPPRSASAGRSIVSASARDLQPSTDHSQQGGMSPHAMSQRSSSVPRSGRASMSAASAASLLPGQSHPHPFSSPKASASSVVVPSAASSTSGGSRPVSGSYDAMSVTSANTHGVSDLEITNLELLLRSNPNQPTTPSAAAAAAHDPRPLVQSGGHRPSVKFASSALVSGKASTSADGEQSASKERGRSVLRSTGFGRAFRSSISPGAPSGLGSSNRPLASSDSGDGEGEPYYAHNIIMKGLVGKQV